MFDLQGKAGEGGEDSTNFSSSLHQTLNTEANLNIIMAVMVGMKRRMLTLRQKET